MQSILTDIRFIVFPVWTKKHPVRFLHGRGNYMFSKAFYEYSNPLTTETLRHGVLILSVSP